MKQNKSDILVGIYKADYSKRAANLINVYKAILKYNNIEYIELYLNQTDFWKNIPKLDLFIYRWAHIDEHRQIAATILPIIEKHYKILCFPNENTCWHFDDKIKQYYLLKKYDFPIIESFVFWEKKEALTWAINFEYPVVFKLKGGAGSQDVVLVKNAYQAKRLIYKMFGQGIKNSEIPVLDNIKYKNITAFTRKIGRKIFEITGNKKLIWSTNKNYVLFQKYLPGNLFDTRITIIGDRAFAFRRMVRKNDFRASGSGNIDHNQDLIDKRCINTAFQISLALDFQTMTYDFIYDKDRKPYIAEISYAFMDLAVQACPGYWDNKMNWHSGHYWPQFCQLVDLLKLPELKQPKIHPKI
ncbi:hypothetical protein ACFLSX_03855 [Calditrichota bacterium]